MSSDMVVVENRSVRPVPEWDHLQGVLRRQTSLQRALAWFDSQTPRLVPADLIAQDEFCYDLLVPLPGGLWLSYESS
ncbi:MAG: hypothetical protein ACRCZF_04490 [Gemmataceae bacterium]